MSDNTLELKRLPLDDIIAHPGIQSRTKMNDAVVKKYAETVDSMPPVTVVQEGDTYYLADGFHRFAAAKQAEKKAIKARVSQGTFRDALLISVGSNAHHGLPRERRDDVRCVFLLLSDPVWANASSGWIASQTRVSDKTVTRLRVILSELQQGSTDALIAARMDSFPALSYLAMVREQYLAIPGFSRNSEKDETGEDVAVTRNSGSLTQEDSPPFGQPDVNPEVRVTRTGRVRRATAEPVKRGATIVNGVEASDTEKTQELRDKGVVPEEATVSITDVGGGPEETASISGSSGSTSRAVPIEERVATLPLMSQLGDTCQEIFRKDAVLYYKIMDLRQAVGRKASQSGLSKSSRNDGQFSWMTRRWLSVYPPEHWLLCPPPEVGGCGGIGVQPILNYPCPKCHGNGYLVVEK